MAIDWEVLNQRFINESDRTGITVKAWCKQQELNYNTARRYIKPRANLAQSPARKVNCAQNVKSAQEMQFTKSYKPQIQLVNENKSDAPANNEALKNTPTKKRAVSLGNQNARTYGHYSEFITTDADQQRFSSASLTTLREELNLMRMQLSNLMDAIKDAEACLRGDVTVKEKVRLHESYAKYQAIFNVKIARIESLENSLVSQEKMKADTEKTIALTRKARLEADNLSREADGGKTPLDEIYEDILAMNHNGMLNKY